MTFVTPTLLAGDRSLSDTIAHELAHSCIYAVIAQKPDVALFTQHFLFFFVLACFLTGSGNLVSCKYWDSFFLNEGFTVLLERKIGSKVHDAADDPDGAYFHLKSMLGWDSLKDSVAQFGENHEFTSLVPPIEDIDPDDSFSSVPYAYLWFTVLRSSGTLHGSLLSSCRYEKGFQLLWKLQRLVGGAQPMNAFLRAWFDTFKVYLSFSCNRVTCLALICFFISYDAVPVSRCK